MSDSPTRLLADLLPLLEDSSATFLLETQHPFVGTNLLASYPTRTLTAHGSTLTLKHNDGSSDVWNANAWDALNDTIGRYPGWWFCALGYDLKNQDEHLSSNNPDPVGLPDLIAIQPSLLVEQDKDGELKVIEGTFDLETNIRALKSSHVELTGGTTTKDSYLDTIRRVKSDIHEGEYYELNLTHQLEGELRGSVYDLYRHMAAKGPVPMGSFITFGDTSVVCASPERYLKREGDRVISEPIKGTRPRSSDPQLDQAMIDDLINSEKDRAENLMIVDLVRNDLARIADKGSVQVEHLFEIRTYATVHQMVSTVKATVSDQILSVDIIRNTFPMGSMTGAPKIRVMQAIESYETYRRGLYSGAIGYIAPNGDFDFNVVIRSAFVKNGRVWFPVGGAITSDSDPVSEWEETLVKARALP